MIEKGCTGDEQAPKGCIFLLKNDIKYENFEEFLQVSELVIRLR